MARRLQSLRTEGLACRPLATSPHSIPRRPTCQCPTSTAATISLLAATTRHRPTSSLTNRCMANVRMPRGERSCFAPLCVLTFCFNSERWSV